MGPLLPLTEAIKQMVNDCIRTGLANEISTLKRLSKLCYPTLANYKLPSYYKLCAISKATGILANRRKSVKRGYKTKRPCLKKPLLLSCYGFKIIDGVLRVPLGNKKYFDIALNNYTRRILSDPAIRVRSFTVTGNITVSICYSKQAPEVHCSTTSGIDRNLRNLTVGNSKSVIQYNLSKAVDITEKYPLGNQIIQT